MNLEAALISSSSLITQVFIFVVGIWYPYIWFSVSKGRNSLSFKSQWSHFSNHLSAKVVFCLKKRERGREKRKKYNSPKMESLVSSPTSVNQDALPNLIAVR